MLFTSAVVGLNPIQAGAEWGGGGNPNLFLHISSSWVERNLHTEFQLHWMSISGRFMVGGATKSNKAATFP